MNPSTNHRLPQLDALRGLAALVVVFNHYAQTVPENVWRSTAFRHGAYDAAAWLTPFPWLRFTPLRLLVEGEAAVDTFFVLSGFVLAIHLAGRTGTSYRDFVIKRFCRIYAPFFIIVVGIYVVYIVFPPAKNGTFSIWLNSIAPSSSAVSLASLTRHLSMLGQSQDDMILDPVMWTLIHELRISIFVPAIVWSILRFGARKVFPGYILLSVCASIELKLNTVGTWQATAHFVWMFAAGSVMAIHRAGVARRLAELGNKATLVLWIAVLLLMTCQFDHDWSDFNIGIAACMMIAICLAGGSKMRVLMSPIALWLGRVSYSLYLTHLPVLVLAMCRFESNRLSAFMLSLLIAEITFRFVEAPSQKLGKLLTGKRLAKLSVGM